VNPARADENQYDPRLVQSTLERHDKVAARQNGIHITKGGSRAKTAVEEVGDTATHIGGFFAAI